MRVRKHLLVILVAGLLVAALPLAAVAAPDPAGLLQDDPPEEEPTEEPDGEPDDMPWCNPAAARLAEWMSGTEAGTVDEICAMIVDYMTQDVGIGVISKAYGLSQVFPELEWEDLVARHTSEEGLGWGRVKKAYWLAEVLGTDGESLLSQHEEGMGWGEIRKAQGEETDETLSENGGKPPWATQGPPPWAHGNKPPKSNGNNNGNGRGPKNK